MKLATNFQELSEQENVPYQSFPPIRWGEGGLEILRGYFVLKKSSVFEISIVKVLVPAALVLGLLKHLELKWRMEEG